MTTSWGGGWRDQWHPPPDDPLLNPTPLWMSCRCRHYCCSQGWDDVDGGRQRPSPRPSFPSDLGPSWRQTSRRTQPDRGGSSGTWMTCSSFSLSRTALCWFEISKKHVWQQAADAASLFDICCWCCWRCCTRVGDFPTINLKLARSWKFATISSTTLFLQQRLLRLGS